MSDYKGIKGFNIQTRTVDPVPFAQAIQNNPYAGVWGSGGDLNTAGQGRSSAGTQTSNIVYGGAASPYTAVEEYNGSSWTETTEINTGKIYAFGFGANAESALMSGGYTNPSGPMFTNTETWNGSSWTEVNEMNAARGDGGSFGVVPGGIAAGGYSTPPTTTHDDVESWNGTSWSDSAAELNQARYYGSGVGYTSTAGLIIGGKEPSLSDKVESWNGSSWTEIAEINTARERVGGSGSSTAGLVYGGGPSASAATEDWNGTVWTEVNDMATARYGLASSPSGTSTLALASGGYTTTTTAATEEWSFSGLQPTDPAEGYADAIVGDFYYNSSTGQYKTVNDGGAPIGTWASGNNLNTARDNMAGAGTQTSAMSVNGSNPPPTNISNVENYDGTSWAETTENNTPRRYATANGVGGNTSVIYIGGYGAPPVANIGNTEIWNGSSWSETGDLDKGRNNLASAGTTTANVAFGGETNPPFGGASQAYTELFDGSSWTEVNALNEGRNSKAGAGTSGAAISVDEGGTTNVELWDGTSWSETTDYNTTRGGSVTGPSSPQSDVLLMTGVSPSGYKANCEHWNGTTWTEVADVSTAMTRGGGAGTGGTSGLKFGGSTPSNTAATEEFTAADFEIKSVTTS